MHRAIIYGCHEAAIVLYKKVDPVFATRTSDSIIISQISQGLVSDLQSGFSVRLSIISAFVSCFLSFSIDYELESFNIL